MGNTINFNDFIGTSSGDESKMLGKFLYFSLANLLVKKADLEELCLKMNIPYTVGKRVSAGDAFRSATGDIRQRIVVNHGGETTIYMVYCRDNRRSASGYSRELVKETLNRQTNQYEKLANITFDKATEMIYCDNMVFDPDIDVYGCCRQAEELFELYKECANRKQIETICTGFLQSIEAVKLSVNGHMYFVPNTFMGQVDTFEDFITGLGEKNQKGTPLMVNSFYIIDDEKQRGKMAEEVYLALKKEIEKYQDRCDYFIKSGCNSPAVMERWAAKVHGLEARKRRFEEILQREIIGLNDDFSTLKLLSQELQVRADTIRFQKAA